MEENNKTNETERDTESNVKSTTNVEADGADFEEAIALTGYGKFNYIVLLIVLPCCTSNVFDTTTMSIILPSAECDLNLTMQDKGMLNAITYMGMISSAFLWGFLSDVLGRKKLLVYGYLTNGLFNLLCAFSQSFGAILVFKFICGFISSGPFAILMTYLSELHGLKYRSRVMLSTGICFSMAAIALPSIALLIIPNPQMNISLFLPWVGKIELHSWQTFLFICALPSIFSGLAVMLILPESPKFLLSRGRNKAAMNVFVKIHRMNNGSHVEYPVKKLFNEMSNSGKVESKTPSMNPVIAISVSKASPWSKLINGIRGGFSQLSVMLKPPHLKNACLVYTIQFCILYGLNTFRLWTVQLFAIIKEYETEFSLDGAEIDSNLCEMIEYKLGKSSLLIHNNTENADVLCEANLDGEMFFNTMMISVIQLIMYLLASTLINTVGNRIMLVCGLAIAGISMMCLNFAKGALTTMLFSAGYITLSSISSTTLVTSVVSLFPTSTRTMNVSLAMMFGRLGAIIGNLLFPWLLSLGCLPAFSMIGGFALVCSVICNFIPKTTKRALQ